jgi:hypothetical protein
VPVRRLPIEDPVGPDDAGEADVDHAPRRLDVEPDPEAEQEDRRRRERPRRPDGRQRTSASAEPHPQAAGEQVGEDGVDERHAAEDLAAVEERERHREAEEREEVEVSDGEGPPQVGEPEQEHEAQGEPHVRLQERLPAERSLAATRHLPRDLRPGPCLRHAPGAILDDDLRDLARLARPRLHEPGLRLRAVVGVGRGIRRIAVEPGRDPRMCERGLGRLALVEARELGLRRRRRGKDERDGRERGERG